MSINIDWSKAPEWAGAVVASGTSRYWVKGWGMRSKRQNLNNDFLDSRKADTKKKGHVWELVCERPKVWNGEGLPPVGTMCEHKDYGGVTILAHGVFRGNLVVIAQGDDTIVTATADFYFPLRTPEQIAAEERDKAIKGMIDDTNILTGIMSDRRIMAGQLYDAGYRKQVAP